MDVPDISVTVSCVTPLQIVGGGKMGEALGAGMVRSGWIAADALTIVEVGEARRAELEELIPGAVITDRAVARTDTVLAVKPHLVVDVAASLEVPTRLVSIAAGITTAAIEAVVPDGTPVLRVMPNTPSLVGLGASGVAPGAAASDADVAWASSMLEAVGIVVPVTETQLDAVTGLSGSGPAYYFMIAEAMVDGGVAAGLTRDAATQLAFQTMAGAAAMLAEGTRSPSELRGDVTTPNGTTAAGLRVLEQQGLRAAVIDAVVAATERSRELGAQ